MKPIKGMTFAQMFDEASRRLEEEERRVAAMTPAEREQYAKEQAARAAETEEILKKLRGPGFIEIRGK